MKLTALLVAAAAAISVVPAQAAPFEFKSCFGGVVINGKCLKKKSTARQHCETFRKYYRQLGRRCYGRWAR